MFAILKSSTPAHDGRQLGKKSITRFISSLIKGKKNESKSAPQSPEKHTTKDTAQSRPTPSTQRSSRTRRSSVTLSTWRWSNYLAPTPALSYLSSLSSSTNASTQPPATPVDPSLPKGTSRPEFAFFASQHEPQSEEYLPVDPHIYDIYDDYDFLSDPPNPSAYLDDHRYDDRTEALGLSHSSTFGPCPPPKPFKTKEPAPRLTQRPSTPEPNVVADYGQVTFCLTRDKVWTDDWKERLRTAFLDEEDFTTAAPPDLRLLHSPEDVHPRHFTHGRLPLRPICVRPRRRRAPRPSRQLLDEPTFDAFFQTFNV